MRDRLPDLIALLPLAEGKPVAMAALARQFAAAGDRARAADLAARALAAAPGDGEVRTIAREVLSDGVPAWHFAIVRDRRRNRAYAEALERAVFAGARVLEIGTGTGLLAMLAARAGAEVVTCEADPAIAAAAAEAVAANGLAGRVRVVAKHSTALDADADLGGRADILVSEIVSNDLLNQGVLAAHEDAVARLLKPGARVIPGRGRVRVALAEDSEWSRRRMPGDLGFDLSAFDRLARPYWEAGAARPNLALRGEPADLFAFDFAAGPWGEARAALELASHGGSVGGVVQWIALEMDAQGGYENRPGGEASCWAPLFWPFAEPIETRPGELVRIAARHERDRLRIWREP